MNLNYATLLTTNQSVPTPHQANRPTSSLPPADEGNWIEQTSVLHQHQWKHLLVQTHREPLHIGPVLMKAVPETQIILRTSGITRLQVRTGRSSRNFHVQPGDLFLTAANREPYELEWRSVADQPIHTLHIYLSNALLTRTAAEVLNIDDTRLDLQDDSCLDDPLLRQLSYSLGHELAHSRDSSALFVETAAHLMAVQLLRQHCTSQHTLTEYRGKIAPNRLNQVKDYVVAHLDQVITLDNLAAVACMSPFHFCRVFRQTMGQSPNQYVTAQRLTRAQQLLRTGQPVAQVAEAVGYTSSRHFAQLFLRHVGCLPSRFR